MIDIELKDVTYSYPDGTAALQGLTASLPSGSGIAILGGNGAGKSTLAQLISGLLLPTKGDVILDGINTRDISAARTASLIGYVFANPRRQLFASSVREEISFGPRNLGFAEAVIRKYVNLALEVTELERWADSHPYDLNPSCQKRLTWASVLAMNTPAVILDEPTSSLDGHNDLILQKLLTLWQERGVTRLIISHDADFVAETCTSALLLERGRLLFQGNITSTLLHPGSPDQPCPLRLAQELNWQDKPTSRREFCDIIRKY